MRRRGFTLIEMLVTVVLVGVALVAVMVGIRTLTVADIKARKADLLQRLASQKMNELNNVTDPRTGAQSGDFTDSGYPDISFQIDDQPSGVDNLDKVTITTTQGNDSQVLTTMVYIRPTTTTTTTGTTGQ